MHKITPFIIITGLLLTAGLVHPPAATAGSNEAAKHMEGLKLMQGFVGFVEQWMSTVEDPSNAIGLATHSLKDLYVEAGEAQRVIQILNETLKIVEDPAGRNSIRFTLAELHKQLGQPKQASDHLLKIIEENAKGKGGYKASTAGGMAKSVFE